MYFILLGLGEKQGERKKEKEKTLDIGNERAGEREKERVLYILPASLQDFMQK